MKRKRAATILLVMSVLVGLGFRMVAVYWKPTVSHDEGISYLAATGHQAEYSEMSLQGTYPAQEWVPLSEWKRYFQPDRFFCFKQIGSDLARYDYHPPLYFWILHVWVSVFGVGAWSGPVLNLVLVLIVVALLFRFACQALHDRLDAAAVVGIWLLSPYAMQVSTEARHYELFALFSLVLMFRSIKYVENREHPDLKELVLVGLLTLAGALTHYYFASVVAGCGLLVLFRLGRGEIGRCLKFYAAIVLGYAASLLFHPAVSQLTRAREEKEQAVDIAEALARLKTVATTVAQFFVHQRAGDVVLTTVTLALLVGLAIVFLKGRSRTADDANSIPRVTRYVLYFVVWNIASISLLYVLCLTPWYAMGPKYLAAAWPFIGFVPVLISRLIATRWRAAFLFLVIGWQLFYGSLYAAVGLYRKENGPNPEAVLNRADAVLSDSLARGIFPRILFILKGDKRIFASHQQDLLDDTSRWIEGLPEKSVYVSNHEYGNTPEREAAILSEIEKLYDASPVESGLYDYDFFLTSR